MNLDIFFYETFQEEEELLRKYLPPGVTAEFTWKTIQEAQHTEPPAGIISVRTQSVLPLQWASRLNAILSRSTGYNHLLKYKADSGTDLICGYLPLYCHRAVAEQAMLLWMTLWRRLPLQIKQFRTFSRDGLTGLEAQGKELLVVGVGNIGYEVVKIGTGLDMKVTGVDIVERHEDVTYKPIRQAIGQADVVVCAMNLTARNRAYFNYELLKKMRKGSLFINVSRGEISPSLDLLRVLKERHIGGVALDVYDEESELAMALRQGKASMNPQVRAVLEMMDMDNVILTPHNAFNSIEGVERKARQSMEQVSHFFRTGEFKWMIPDV